MVISEDIQLVDTLRERITDEIFNAFGLGRSGWARRWFGRLFWLPANRFARIAARFDQGTAEGGLCLGAQRILTDLSQRVSARGVEFIPDHGPVLIVSNHPGAFDSVCIASCIPRKDMKIFASDVGFSRALTSAQPYVLYVPAEGSGRMTAIRGAIQHLQNGGAVMIFAQGDVEPDPELMPGAHESIQSWSRSLEVMLRKAPQSQVVIAIASGAMLPQFVHSPIARIRRYPPHRQKLAEFIQIISQLVAPSEKRIAHVHVSFSPPVSLLELSQGDLMAGIIQRAQILLEEHLEFFIRPGSRG